MHRSDTQRDTVRVGGLGSGGAGNAGSGGAGTGREARRVTRPLAGRVRTVDGDSTTAGGAGRRGDVSAIASSGGAVSAIGGAGGAPCDMA